MTASGSAPTDFRSTPTATPTASSSRRSTCRRRASCPRPARTGTPATRLEQRAQRRVRAGQRPVAMGYWDDTDIPFYYGLGRTFPVCDRFFCSVLAQTFPNRRFLIAGTAAGIVSTDVTALLAPRRRTARSSIARRARDHVEELLRRPADHRRRPVGVREVPGARGRQHAVPHRRRRGQAAVVLHRRPQLRPPVRGEPAGHPPGRAVRREIINAAMHGPAWDKTLLIWTYDEHGGYYDHVAPPAGDQARRHPARHPRAARPPAPTTGTGSGSRQ